MSEEEPAEYGDLVTQITLDAEHRRILGLLEQLQEAAFNRRREALQVADQLLSFLGLHFRREEAYLFATGASSVQLHIDDHDALLEGLQMVRLKLSSPETYPTSAEMLNVRNRMIVHMLHWDQRPLSVVKPPHDYVDLGLST